MTFSCTPRQPKELKSAKEDEIKAGQDQLDEKTQQLQTILSQKHDEVESIVCEFVHGSSGLVLIGISEYRWKEIQPVNL